LCLAASLLLAIPDKAMRDVGGSDGQSSDERLLRWPMDAGSLCRKSGVMNSEMTGTRNTRSWRRCALCGQFFSFPRSSSAPRDCAACGNARLAPSSRGLSLRRLRLLGE